MSLPSIRIERLSLPPARDDLRQLGELLVDAVESGAAVSFVLPLPVESAIEWWKRTTESPQPKAIFLVARDERGIVGTVNLQPAWAPNQPHRAEVCKLMVHRRARKSGVGEQLMRSAESSARANGFSLLTLDAKRGGAAQRLYERLGWTFVGVIPDYAIDPDRSALHDTVIFYKKVPPA